MKTIQLFCLSYAGGSAQEYKRWKGIISDQIEIIPITLPGHGKRLKEELLTSIEAMVEYVYMQIKDKIVENKYAFFGHSMGAIIAHELTNKVKEMGLPEPCCLFVSGREAPHLAHSHEDMLNLPEDEFRQRIAYYGGTPDEIFEDPYLKKIFLPILLTDLTACDTYQKYYKERTSMVVEAEFVVLAGREEVGSEEQLEGWQRYSRQKISIYYFSGGHFFIHDKENIRKIAEIINKKLVS